MEPYQHRLFVCTKLKEEGKSSCAARGAEEVFNCLKAEIEKRGLALDVKAIPSGCLDLCEQGPNVLVYPESRFYSRLTCESVPDFVQTQLVQNQIYQPHACDEQELEKFFVERRRRKMLQK